MANANGRISTKDLAALPKSWSSRGRAEYLRDDAYASLSRATARAVAVSGENFQVYDAYRSLAEQITILKKYYFPVSGGRRSGDRALNGVTYRKRAGMPAAASPGHSNHGTGTAIDIHHNGVQDWFKSEGRAYGWTWDEGRRLNESWHFVYDPGLDQMRSEGVLDHAAVQRAVGADVDGKIGVGTVRKIKAWQSAHGLTPDGKVGAKTKAAMLGKAVADVVENVIDAITPEPVGLTIQEAGPAKNAYSDRKGHKLKHVTIHWWGRPSGQTFTGIRDYLIDNSRQVSAHYVVSGTQVARILPESRGAWGNGDRTANLEGIVIECDPNRVAETLPTVAALLADIFKRNGVLDVYPHDHWTSTECPGDYRAHIPALVAAAKGGDLVLVAPVTKPVVKPVKPVKGQAVTVDGRFGSSTVKVLQTFLNGGVPRRGGILLTVDGKAGHSTWWALQAYLDTFPDGVVSNQSHKAVSLGNGITGGWDYDGPGASGSSMVKALQRWVGVAADGVWGEKTTAALQRKLNVVS